jgi:nicotinamide mononucleotide transporter
VITQTINYLINLPLLELFAVILSLAYVLLAAKENSWCWAAALISTIIYTFIFYDVYLWMDSLLQVYYMLMAIYGWYSWQKGKLIAGENDKTIEITSWSLPVHIKHIGLLTLISLIVGYLMANYSPAHFPYLDSITTVFAVYATYLVTQKILENWLYWVVIDFVSIYLYIEKGLVPTAALFVVYVFIAFAGYFSWRKQLMYNTTAANA